MAATALANSATAAYCAPAVEPTATEAAVVVEFPAKPVYGWIEKHHGATGPGWHGPATGVLRLDTRCMYDFKASPVISENLDLLDKLPANNIVSLWMADCELGDKELKRLSRFKKLQALTLDSTEITDDFLEVAGGLADLRILDIGHTEVKGSGLAHLAKLGKLWNLRISNNPMDPKEFALFGNLKNLVELDARQTGLTDDGLAAIGKLEQITVLHLGKNQKLTDEGLKKLGALKKLRNLDIAGSKITAATLAKMKFPALKMILISKDQLGKDGDALLAKAYPGATITHYNPAVRVDLRMFNPLH